MAKRLSVNLSDEVAGLLQQLAESRETTVTEVIRSAISTEWFLDQETRNGSKILLAEPGSDRQKELVFTASSRSRQSA